MRGLWSAFKPGACLSNLSAGEAASARGPVFSCCCSPTLITEEKARQAAALMEGSSAARTSLTH